MLNIVSCLQFTLDITALWPGGAGLDPGPRPQPGHRPSPPLRQQRVHQAGDVSGSFFVRIKLLWKSALGLWKSILCTNNLASKMKEKETINYQDWRLPSKVFVWLHLKWFSHWHLEHHRSAASWQVPHVLSSQSLLTSLMSSLSSTTLTSQSSNVQVHSPSQGADPAALPGEIFFVACKYF